MSTQTTGSYDFKAAKSASEEATEYLTTVDQTGLMVHPENDTTTGWKISNALELLKSGITYIKAWLGGTNNNEPMVQIGPDTSGHIIMDSDSATIYSPVDQFGESEVIAHLGYGEGTGPQGQTGIEAPYYTLGTRNNISNVIGNYSLVEGYISVAEGFASHAEGQVCFARGNASHAEGNNSIANGHASHAEGNESHADGQDSHAEGQMSEATGSVSHAEGNHSTASGPVSHSEGSYTVASARNSHAQNLRTIAASESQTAIGAYNIEDSNGTYAFIIGNGNDNNTRSNAMTVDWNGNATTSGAVDAEINMSARGDDGDNIEVMAYNRTRSKGVKLAINSNGATHGIYSDFVGGWMIGIGSDSYLYLRGTAFHSLFAVSTGAVTIANISANGYNSATGNTVSKSGYYPIGIVGYDITGTGSGSIPPIKYYLTSQAAGSCKVFAGLHNDSSTARANITFTAYILWVKII